MLKKIFLFPFISIWIFLSLYSIEQIIIFGKILINHFDYFLFLFVGFISYFISLLFIKPKKYEYWNIFWHEFSHLIFAILTFSKIQQFTILSNKLNDGTAGYVKYSFKKGKFSSIIRNHFVSLAPYFFSPITMILLCIYLFDFNQINIVNILLFFIGLSYSYHLVIVFIQARPYQKDFKDVGYIYGMSFILFMQLVFLIIILFILNLRIN
jgi:hypothetical protein